MTLSPREQLAHWRSISARHSLAVVDLAPGVLKTRGLGEEEWAVREQLAFAALDLGRADDAETQINALQRKFPDSPRVAILEGMLLEVRGDEKGAKRIYSALLDKDETNVAAHQRELALLLPDGPSVVIPNLLAYLDTFYTDAAGWSLLSDQYAEAGLHAQALSALGHVMLINTWDSDAVERAAALAYTLGDHQLALKHYLRAIEMSTPPEGPASVKSRLWWGVRQTTNRLLETASTSESSVPLEQQCSRPKLEALLELAVERLLESGAKGVQGDITKKVLGDATGPR